jgi:hypothetical protein
VLSREGSGEGSHNASIPRSRQERVAAVNAGPLLIYWNQEWDMVGTAVSTLSTVFLLPFYCF